MTRFDVSKFTASKAKPLPVVLLLDVSGSMNEVLGDTYERTGQTLVEDGQTWEIVKGGVSRIEVLNKAVLDMVTSLAKEEQLGHEFLVSVITFGSAVSVHLPPTKASLVAWKPLEASGETPLGGALTRAKQIIEDREATPSRAYRPVVVLVSDGKPTDSWKSGFDDFIQTGRTTKCDRLAVALGAGTDEDMLRQFLVGTPNQLFQADDAKQIHDIFKRVTMSVATRSKSKDPDQIVGLARIPVGPVSPAKPAQATPEASKESDDDGYW